MHDSHFCAFGIPIYIHNSKLSKEADFLFMLQRLSQRKLSSCMYELDFDAYDYRLPHICIINRLSKIFHFIKEKFPAVLQLRNKTKLPTCLHLAVFIGRSDIVASLLQMGNTGVEAKDLKLPDVLRLGRELMKTLPQDIMSTQYLFLESDVRTQYLERVTGETNGIPVRFGDEVEYNEIEKLLQIYQF